MNAYYDTGTILPLYVNEAFSARLNAFLQARGDPIPFSGFHRLELENALRLKVFRGEIEAVAHAAALAAVEAHLTEGRFVVRAVQWVAALEAARDASRHVTIPTGCRTLDLIHIAIAMQWGCPEFVSADDRQLKAAKRLGLATVDIRTFPGDAQPDVQGRVRERRGTYRTKRRPVQA